jgi:glyoxylase-like metal-dependent hydrolase (beta-lactamase superfamily II)
MALKVRVGDAIVAAISDKWHAVERSFHFPSVPAEAWEPYRDLLTADGRILLNFGCYLVWSDDRIVLVDTGWGPELSPPGMDPGRGALLDELATLGVTSQDVDLVVFTHLHPDHVGWNLVREGEVIRPRFISARYLVPEGDWVHYNRLTETHPNIRLQALPLAELGVVELIGGDHAVSPSLTTIATPGHTPGHQSLVVRSGGDSLFILGDLAHTPVVAHETEWPNKFDWDPELAKATRRRVLDGLERDGQLVAAGHFPHPGIGRFVRVDGRRVWRPL